VNGGVSGGVKPEYAYRWNNILQLLKDGNPRNISQLNKEFGWSRRTLERDIATLKDKGLIKFWGAPKTGGYVLTEKGIKKVNELRL